MSTDPRTLVRSWATPRRDGARRGRNAPNWLLSLIVPVALLVLWQVVTERGVYSRSQLPAPLDVVAAGRQLVENDTLGLHLSASVGRVAWGFAYGALVAIPLALLVGLSRLASTMLSPTIQALRAIPSLAWVPLLILWLGIDEAPKITLVAIGVFFPVYTNLVGGIGQIDRKLIEAGHAYGLRGFALAREVLLPASLPSLLTGLRLGLAQGWLFLVAAELIAASRGLGFLLVDGQNTGRADIIVLSIVLLALLGQATDWLVQRASRRWLRWADVYGSR
ncbi:MAG: ABC transporter permease [Chloroflexota bacterium]|nr:ABC transporter permease [Chloroflexota bacterium]